MDNIKTGCKPDQNTAERNKAKGRPGFHGRGLKSPATAAALTALAAEHAAEASVEITPYLIKIRRLFGARPVIGSARLSGAVIGRILTGRVAISLAG